MDNSAYVNKISKAMMIEIRGEAASGDQAGTGKDDFYDADNV